MSARRFVSRMRGLGFHVVQHAPAPAGASAAPGTVTSLREFARALQNPREFLDG